MLIHDLVSSYCNPSHIPFVSFVFLYTTRSLNQILLKQMSFGFTVFVCWAWSLRCDLFLRVTTRWCCLRLPRVQKMMEGRHRASGAIPKASQSSYPRKDEQGARSQEPEQGRKVLGMFWHRSLSWCLRMTIPEGKSSLSQSELKICE